MLDVIRWTGTCGGRAELDQGGRRKGRPHRWGRDPERPSSPGSRVGFEGGVYLVRLRSRKTDPPLSRRSTAYFSIYKVSGPEVATGRDSRGFGGHDSDVGVYRRRKLPRTIDVGESRVVDRRRQNESTSGSSEGCPEPTGDVGPVAV